MYLIYNQPQNSPQNRDRCPFGFKSESRGELDIVYIFKEGWAIEQKYE